jgi:hypothetical protein
MTCNIQATDYSTDYYIAYTKEEQGTHQSRDVSYRSGGIPYLQAGAFTRRENNGKGKIGME